MPGGVHPSFAVVAAWPPANYDHPDHMNGLLPSVIVFAIVAFAMVGARLVVRGSIQKNMGLDDWIIMFAMLPTLGLVIVVCYAGARLPFGVHLWDVRITDWIMLRKAQFAIELLYVWSSSLVKISILFFFRRLSAATLTKSYVRICWAGIIFCALYMISFTFVFFDCKPVSAYWSQFTFQFWATHQDFSTEWTCSGEPSITMVSGAVSLFLDIVAAILPTWLFYVLKIPIREKIALGFVFIVGFISCAIGALRIWLTHRLFFVSYDVTWVGYPLLTLTAIEPLLGSICASAPALKIIFRRAVDRYHASSRDATASYKVASIHSPRETYATSGARNSGINHGRVSSVDRTGPSEAEAYRTFEDDRVHPYNASGKSWASLSWTEKNRDSR